MHKSQDVCRSASLFIHFYHFYTIRWQHIFKAKGYTPKAVITLIPPRIKVRHPYPSFSHVQASVIKMLMFPISLATLQQPIQLPCTWVYVRSACIIDWIRISAQNKCPCCYDLAWLQNGAVKPPPDMVNALLGDVILCCSLCQQGVRASDCDKHKCGRRQCSKLQLQISCACPYGQLTNQYTLEELYIPCS